MIDELGRDARILKVFLDLRGVLRVDFLRRASRLRHDRYGHEPGGKKQRTRGDARQSVSRRLHNTPPATLRPSPGSIKNRYFRSNCSVNAFAVADYRDATPYSHGFEIVAGGGDDADGVA